MLIHRTIIIAIVFLFNLSSFANPTPTIQKVSEFSNNQENTLKLPVDFAQDFLLHPEDLEKIKDKTIHHIDLVYTAYRTSPDFNQTDLNYRRMNALLAQISPKNKGSLDWKWVEQQGATTLTEAQKYFHGFVIHFGDALDYSDLKSFFSSHQDTFTTWQVSNKKATTKKTESGSTIHIPANAVVTKSGKVVQGDYELQYREFRDQADIVFSGIPMTYTNNDGDWNFSSVGMYEIRANQNGEELSLQKPIVIDFNTTGVKDGVGFYQMDDNTGQWVKKKEEVFEQTEPSVKQPTLDFSAELNSHTWMIYGDQRSKNIRFQFDDSLFTWIKETSKGEDLRKFEILLANSDELTYTVLAKDSAAFSKLIYKSFNSHFWKNTDMWNQGVETPNNMASTLLAEGSSDPGHSYPSVVRGLNSPNFGVYNCDQIYRIGKSVTLTPEYIDAETGKNISGKKVACVLDLKYNGSFSFQPNNLTCNAKGKNAILLFTNNHKTYLLMPDEFNTAFKKDGGTPKFAMKDVTESVKTSKDLKKLLQL